MGSAGQDDAGASHLVDVTGVPLDRLVADHQTVLVNSLRRLLTDLDRPQEILSAFDNYAGDPPEFPIDRRRAR
jgi:FXSXX-COOH protein